MSIQSIGGNHQNHTCNRTKQGGKAQGPVGKQQEHAPKSPGVGNSVGKDSVILSPEVIQCFPNAGGGGGKTQHTPGDGFFPPEDPLGKGPAGREKTQGGGKTQHTPGDGFFPPEDPLGKGPAGKETTHNGPKPIGIMPEQPGVQTLIQGIQNW